MDHPAADGTRIRLPRPYFDAADTAHAADRMLLGAAGIVQKEIDPIHSPARRRVFFFAGAAAHENP